MCLFGLLLSIDVHDSRFSFSQYILKCEMNGFWICIFLLLCCTLFLLFLCCSSLQSQADISEPELSGLLHLLTALILCGYLISISLYIFIEVAEVLHASFINQDISMYDDETGTPAQARTLNLNEELGQVHTVLSDKTGTLTCNQK